MAAITDLINQVEDKALRDRLLAEAARLTKQKKFGLVFEDHLPECTPLYGIPVKRGSTVAKKAGAVNDVYRVVSIDGDQASCVRNTDGSGEIIPVSDLVSVAQFGEPIYPTLLPLDSVQNDDENGIWHTLIEADNYHALQLLEYLYPKKVDCIYIDPPYNTGAKDWKYNNDYVDSADSYRHSKWLSMMQKRLAIAKRILNPADSVLIITIDEKEYLHLGCLLEEMFPEARIQMVSINIHPGGVAKNNMFARSDEYAFYVFLGNAGPQSLVLDKEWLFGIETTSRDSIHWRSLLRAGSSPLRINHPLTFYPIYVNEEGTKVVKVGDPIPRDMDRHLIKPEDGTKIIWPIRENGDEGRWQIGTERFKDALQKGYIKLGGFTPRGMAISYLATGEISKVESGLFKIIGHNKDGSIIVDDEGYQARFIPTSQWNIKNHDALRNGSGLIQTILCNKRFDYPKSLYAVHDTIRFCVENKPNALIVDFFAGSGTTMHAVNLLNAEDGGHRRCIMVTNNEVSVEEKKLFEENNIRPGDIAWEEKGIARYVTWPRTVCAIKGINVKGEPLKGDYSSTTEEPIHMATGFKANAEFFKLSFLDKNEVALGTQFNEILPILWLKAGAIGKRPVIADGEKPTMLILPQNKMAVLLDECAFMEFDEQMDNHPEIETVFIVTDSERAYREMISGLKVQNTYQLYRDYLDNFRINARR